MEMFHAFTVNFQMEKNALFLRTGTNNFQTDSLKAHKVHKAREGHAMSSAAKHARERPREERPLPTLPPAKTAVELIKLLLLYTSMLQLLCVTGKKLLKYTYHGVCCYVSLNKF